MEKGGTKYTTLIKPPKISSMTCEESDELGALDIKFPKKN